MRFCIGVDKYTPNDAVPVNGKTTTVRQWKSVYLYWSKLCYMTNDRLNKLIALLASPKTSRSCIKNLIHSVSECFKTYGLTQYAYIAETPSLPSKTSNVENMLFQKMHDWVLRPNYDRGPSLAEAVISYALIN